MFIKGILTLSGIFAIIVLLGVLLFTKPLLFLFFLTVSIIILFMVAGRQEKEAKERQYASAERCKEIYDKKTAGIMGELPDKAFKVRYNSGDIKLLEGDNFIWVRDAKLHLYPSSSPIEDSPENIQKIKLIKIPLNNIEEFYQKGELYRENKISGGGGGGSSLSGAIVGGVIAGGAGAIIGSRKKTESIKSELITHDTRKTILSFYNNNQIQYLSFDYDDFEVFNKLIPEKSRKVVDAIRTSSLVNNETLNITEKIRELSKLKDDGILNEDEFNEKKKDLLSKM